MWDVAAGTMTVWMTSNQAVTISVPNFEPQGDKYLEEYPCFSQHLSPTF